MKRTHGSLHEKLEQSIDARHMAAAYHGPAVWDSLSDQ
jgi:hypothetical protein